MSDYAADDIVMTLDRQFVDSEIVEELPGYWSARIRYSFYSLYIFTESHTSTTMALAIRWLLFKRTGDRLRIVNAQGLNVKLLG